MKLARPLARPAAASIAPPMHDRLELKQPTPVYPVPRTSAIALAREERTHVRVSKDERHQRGLVVSPGDAEHRPETARNLSSGRATRGPVGASSPRGALRSEALDRAATRNFKVWSTLSGRGRKRGLTLFFV